MARTLKWIRFLAPLACAGFLACSGDDTSAGGGIGDASQPVIPKIEAGAPCATNNDCAPGLSCLFPATSCEAFRICTPTPPSPCDGPQVMCSCLAELVTVCDGFATDPVDPSGACEGGVVASDAGPDGAMVGPNDSGLDSSTAPDSSDAALD